MALRLKCLLTGIAATLASSLVPVSASAQLPELPLPLPGVPNVLPGPGGSPLPGAAPPRPDRSPPTPRSRCLDPPPTPLRLRGEVAFSCDFPDPSVLRIGGRYFAYSTATGWERGGHTFPILSSTDARVWRPAGDALVREPRWARGHLWAPQVLRARGYFLYYSALRRRDNLHCLAVATAARPEGPFRDRGPLACRDRRARGFIDPAPFVHRGRTYLFFSVDTPRHSISVLRLRPDLLRPRGRRRVLFGVRHPWQRSSTFETVEAPAPVRQGRRFYLFHSVGCWCADYRMGYLVSRRLLGPYRNGRGNPLLAGKGALVAPGGGSVFRNRTGRPWLAFHAWSGAPAYDRGGVRNLRVAPLSFRRGAPRVLLR